MAAAVKFGPHFPPSRALLSIIRRQGPIQLDHLFGMAQEQLGSGAFRSKTHFKDCMKGLKSRKEIWTYRIDKTGRGSAARDVLAVNANADNRRWKGACGT